MNAVYWLVLTLASNAAVFVAAYYWGLDAATAAPSPERAGRDR